MNKKQKNRKIVAQNRRNRIINRRYSSTVKTLSKLFLQKIENLQNGKEENNEQAKSQILNVMNNLYSIIDGQTDVISRREPNLTPEEVIKKATETVLSLRGIETPTNSRDANKSQLKSQPKSRAGLRHSPPQKPVIDTSPAAVIARQKAQRSQVANRRSV